MTPTSRLGMAGEEGGCHSSCYLDPSFSGNFRLEDLEKGYSGRAFQI